MLSLPLCMLVTVYRTWGVVNRTSVHYAGVMDHIEGLPVGVTAYTNGGCRCDGCREAVRVAMAARRAKGGNTARQTKAYSRTVGRVRDWVRSEHPDVWKKFYAEEWERLG